MTAVRRPRRADAGDVGLIVNILADATTGFYEHLGFRVLATVSWPGAPTLRPMWRDESVDPGVPDGRAIAPRRPVAD